MKRNILIKHKENVVIREENELVSLNYNVILTTPELNTIVKLVIPTITTKSTLLVPIVVKLIIWWKPIIT
jgi:hypothetical protein